MTHAGLAALVATAAIVNLGVLAFAVWAVPEVAPMTGAAAGLGPGGAVVDEEGPALAKFFDCSTTPRIFFFIALAWALIFGWYGYVLIRADQERQPREVPWNVWYARHRCVYLLYQTLFNAVGGFVGWVAVYFLWEVPFENYGWRHFITAIVAFTGVTGNLPYLSMAIPNTLVHMVQRALQALRG